MEENRSIDAVFSEASTLSKTCIIDASTRTIKVPSKSRLFGVTSDKEVNRIYFRCPRIVGDDIDLSTLHLYVNYSNANSEANAYSIDDVAIDGDDITFSWLLSRHVTKYSGKVNFIICAKKSNNEDVTNEWNTKIASGIVANGLEASTIIEEENPDIIDQIFNKLDELDDVSIASSSTPGLVKLGEDFEISEDGTLSLYKELKITSSFEPTIAEKGSTVSEVKVKWSINKIPNYIRFNGIDLPNTMSGTETIPVEYTSDTYYTIEAYDGKKHSNTSQKLSFYSGVYIGVDVLPENITSDFISRLSKKLSSSRAISKTVQANDKQYIWYACPSSYGTPTFYSGGFEGGFSKYETIPFINEYGYEENYDVWKSNRDNLGITTIDVK